MVTVNDLGGASTVTVTDLTSGEQVDVTVATGLVAAAAFATYTHDQASAASVWTITHNLGAKPSVTVVDTADQVCIGTVEYLSLNTVRVTFSAPFSGKAYLN